MNKNTLVIIVGGILIIGGGISYFSGSSPDISHENEIQGDGVNTIEESVSVVDSNTESALAGNAVSYIVDDSSTQGYIAVPEVQNEGGEKFPALILIHEWWGLTDDVRQIADNFAEQGYVALAVDMYNGKVTDDPSIARELSTGVRDNVDAGFENLQSAIDYLESQSYVNSDAIASVGWCFGGQWAYQMALNGLDIDASVMYYGQFNPDDDFSIIKSDILGHFGEDDAVIAIDDVREFQAELATVNGQHDVYIYPNVGHGFANYREGQNAGYDADAAETAWNRTIDFLNIRLGNQEVS